ncbi:MAG: hypothetical protein MJ157_00065 [Clostridia bacterium]|nr:hypothetical protein [Clostridia bacterium]
MSDLKVEPCLEGTNCIVKRITVSNVPDLGDKTGLTLLDNLAEAIDSCRLYLKEGYRLTDFWTDTDEGTQFILKKIEQS